MVPRIAAEATPFTKGSGPCCAGLSFALPVLAPTRILEVHQRNLVSPAVRVCAAIAEGDGVGLVEFQCHYAGQIIIDANIRPRSGLCEEPTTGVVIFV